MATLCRNCGHALVFEPALGKLYCTYCGGQFAAEDVESESKKYRESERVMTRGEVFGDEEVVEEFLEGYVYTCSECGGEITIHGSETSTKCIYCGNPNIVFSRVAKEKMPDCVIPFTVTREQALQSVNALISQSVLLPKDVKPFTVDDIRGIYLPYWIVNANHEESAVVQVNGGGGMYKYSYHGRTGAMTIRNLPLDGCRILSDEISSKLEPFDLNGLKKFDEDYLLGFYSNASDVSYEDLYLATERRAKEIYEDAAKKDFGRDGYRVAAEVHKTAILNDYKYAMLPVWFITFISENKPHTILINGQTGKVVCGLPWRKKAFTWTTILAGAGVGLLAILLLVGLVFGLGSAKATRKLGEVLPDIAILVGMITALIGTFKLINVNKQLKLTQSDATFNFVKKRQG